MNKAIFSQKILKKTAGSYHVGWIVLFAFLTSAIGSYIWVKFFVVLQNEDQFFQFMVLGIFSGTLGIFILSFFFFAIKTDIKYASLRKSHYATWISDKGTISMISVGDTYGFMRRYRGDTKKILITLKITTDKKEFIEEFEVEKGDLPQEIQDMDQYFDVLPLIHYTDELKQAIIERIQKDYGVKVGKAVTIYQNPDDIDDVVIKNPFE